MCKKSTHTDHACYRCCKMVAGCRWWNWDNESKCELIKRWTIGKLIYQLGASTGPRTCDSQTQGTDGRRKKRSTGRLGQRRMGSIYNKKSGERAEMGTNNGGYKNIKKTFRKWSSKHRNKREAPQEVSGHMGDWNQDMRNPDPRTWQKQQPVAKGETQIPADPITKHCSEKNCKTELLVFHNYTSFVWRRSQVQGNEDTLNLVQEPQVGFLYGGPLECAYKLHHLNWISGSDHTINNKRFPLEMQMVHKPTADCDTLNQRNRLAITGFLFDVTKTDNPALDSIIKAMKDSQDTYMKPTEYDLSTLIQPASQGAYRSYTANTANKDSNADSQKVQWVVFQRTISISRSQLEELQKLTGADNKSKNIRPRPGNNIWGRGE